MIICPVPHATRMNQNIFLFRPYYSCVLAEHLLANCRSSFWLQLTCSNHYKNDDIITPGSANPPKIPISWHREPWKTSGVQFQTSYHPFTDECIPFIPRQLTHVNGAIEQMSQIGHEKGELLSAIEKAWKTVFCCHSHHYFAEWMVMQPTFHIFVTVKPSL